MRSFSHAYGCRKQKETTFLSLPALYATTSSRDRVGGPKNPEPYRYSP